MSGKPLNSLSTDILQKLVLLTKKQIPIIASGGVMCASDARNKIRAGANIVQLYTGLIYSGPGLIQQALKAIQQLPI